MNFKPTSIIKTYCYQMHFDGSIMNSFFVAKIASINIAIVMNLNFAFTIFMTFSQNNHHLPSLLNLATLLQVNLTSSCFHPPLRILHLLPEFLAQLSNHSRILNLKVFS